MKIKDIILVALIIILVISLIIMARLYFIMRESAKDSLKSTLQLAEEMFDANVKINKLEKDIENLKNGKEIETHTFYAEIKEIKVENEQTTLLVNGLETNSEDDYRGELKLTINEEVKLLWQKEDIDISKLKMGQNISILHSGVTVTKQDVLIAPFVYEIEILENIQ